MTKFTNYSKRIWIGICLLTALLWSDASYAQVIGRVVSLRGAATLRPKGNLDATPVVLRRGQTLQKGDVIRTGAGSAARLLMKDRSVLDVGPSSYITLSRYDVSKTERSVGVHVFIGQLWARVTRKYSGQKNYRVYSSNAVAGVRGTEFSFAVGERGDTSVTCVRGEVDMESQTGEVQRLQPMMQASLGQQGGFQQRTVTPTEVQTIESAVKTSGGLDPEKAQTRIEKAEASAAKAEGRAPPEKKSNEQGSDEDGESSEETEGEDGNKEGQQSEGEGKEGGEQGGRQGAPPAGGDGPERGGPQGPGPAGIGGPGVNPFGGGALPGLDLEPGQGQSRIIGTITLEQ